MKFSTDKNPAVALLALFFVGLLVMGCVASQNGQPNQNGTATNNSTSNLANPASVYCAQNGGASKIVTAADGSQSGLCAFPDGSQCDEWAYYRGTCSPVNGTTTPMPLANKPGLDASDFIVVEDSMPNILQSGEPVQVPE